MLSRTTRTSEETQFPRRHDNVISPKAITTSEMTVMSIELVDRGGCTIVVVMVAAMAKPIAYSAKRPIGLPHQTLHTTFIISGRHD